MGARNHHLIVDYLDKLKGSIVEIGAGRGEGSTDFFAGLVASRPDLIFHSVDFDPIAHKVIGKYAARISNMYGHQMLGEDFLTDILKPSGERVAWAYLDNFDWIHDPNSELPDWIKHQVEHYKKFDLVMNNENSQRAHLKQAQLIADMAADYCVIHFDDTRLVPAYEDIPRHFDGKGGTAVPWLVSQGWKVLYEDNSNIACANF